jgi:hypothetical protein
MGLIDHVDTEKRIIHALEEKGRKDIWLYENILQPTEDEADLDALLRDLKERKVINNYMGYNHLITPDSEERRLNGKKRKNDATVANTWAWYAWSSESFSYRTDIRNSFTHDDAKVFRALAAIITNERAPRIGSRDAGPMTEEEGRYITKVNRALQAYMQAMKED